MLCSCGEKSTDGGENENNFLPKSYDIDANGIVTNSEMSLDDFHTAIQCTPCHQGHYDQWVDSRHAYSFKNNPLFETNWNSEIEHRPLTGESYCVQCHAPSAFVTGYDLSGINDPNDSSIPEIIAEGVSCDICHSVVMSSNSVYTANNVAAVADYYLNPGEGVKFGSIENPESNTFHESVYSNTYSRSESCLPCHDQFIRGYSIEATFTEWENSFNTMSGLNQCQQCHMPTMPDPSRPGEIMHSHHFVGVDIDLEQPINEASNQYLEIKSLLESSLEISFEYNSETLVESILIGDTLTVPVTIVSNTDHKIPTGTSFSREMWLEIILMDENGNVIEVGKLEDSSEYLDYNDPNLRYFTRIMLDDNSEVTFEASNIEGEIDKTIDTRNTLRYMHYFPTANFNPGTLTITARMLFRPFNPQVLEPAHSDLIPNVPIFEMESIESSIDLIE